MRKSAAVTMDDLLAYGCDHVRVSNADKRMRQRKVLLEAAAARHSQRLLVSCPPERDAYVEELAAYFRPPRDLVDMKQWWGYFMNRRGVPRILYLILAHFRFADIRLAFMRHLILRQSDFSLEDVLEAAADARRVYAETRSSSETLIVAMAFEGSSAMRGTGPHRVTRDFIRRVYAETPLTRRVHAHLKQLHLATPTALSTIVTELQHLLTGLDDAGDLTYTHMGLIRAVLYGSGNEWFYHPSLGGNHVDDYPMAALLAGVGEDHLLVGALACVCAGARAFVPGDTSAAKAQWLVAHKRDLERRAREIVENTGAWPPVVKLLEYHIYNRSAPQRLSKYGRGF